MNVDWVSARYSGESVQYMSPSSFPIFHELKLMPSLRKESIDDALDSSSSFLQASVNFSRGVETNEIPNFFSAATSFGSPFLSRPRGKSTDFPHILWKRANMSIIVYVAACPMWMGVLTYGGGVSIAKTSFPAWNL